MEINRRKLLLKGAAAGAFASLTRGAKAQLQERSQSGVPPGWNTLGLGDGGYVLGVDVCAAGAASGAVCKTDVSGAYFWNGSKWLQLYTASALEDAHRPALSLATATGVWGVSLA